LVVGFIDPIVNHLVDVIYALLDPRVRASVIAGRA
jgi:ABC-type dipeptide/oligopeptide/nickel transport system permease component